jgi:DNA topoisomerase-1
MSSQHLLIVESPAKAKTINKYLGKDFSVLASYGHVRDLRPKDGAVDTEHGFAMHYEIIERNQKHVDAIAKAMRKADTLYLATDPDREGEAIAWHLAELLEEKGLLKDKPVKRVVFYEITQRAVKQALEEARELSLDLINAQQARRALDYLVGFNLSPLLWKKVRRGLSAGRVQTPALRMIAERELEIDAFVAREYWSVEADLNHPTQPFMARLTYLDTVKLQQFSITDETGATGARERLMAAANGELVVASVEKKQRRRNPAPPFTTSTLQQEASRKLGFSASRTMRVAQQLYEGIDIEGGTTGLITYMRTDSVSLAGEATTEIRDYIAQRFGVDQRPAEVRVFKTRSKNAQEAHEAVRPTSILRTPDSLKGRLSNDQERLYELVWKRTLACQMSHALINTVAVDFACGDVGQFRSTGSTVAEPGYLQVYEESTDNAKEAKDDSNKKLPAMEKGDRFALVDIRPEQHFTEPPPRFSEASLVKTLEEYGIGRPSTYASIIGTLLSREYVELESRRFHPTDVGLIVAQFLTEHFERYVDYEFTARLEDDLDCISRGEKEWVPVLAEFWTAFDKRVKEKGDVDRPSARELGTDPVSGLPVSARMGRYGAFVQIGTREDEEKPKFASLLPGQRLAAVTLEQAMALFKLPRDLGETADGEPLSTNIGRFGPYVRYGKKYVSLGPDDDPYTVTPERALELVAEKIKADAERIVNEFTEVGISVLNGRYGPYITDGNKNVKVPKDREPASITMEEAKELIAQAPPPRPKRGGKKTSKKTAKSSAEASTLTASKKKTSAKKKPTAKKKATTRKKATAKKKTATKKKAAPSS